jgi:hypothetical protein
LSNLRSYSQVGTFMVSTSCCCWGIRPLVGLFQRQASKSL